MSGSQVDPASAAIYEPIRQPVQSFPVLRIAFTLCFIACWRISHSKEKIFSLFSKPFEITHVPFRDGTACPLPANIAHDAVPLGQHVESNGSPQILVMLQNKNAVVNGLQDIVFAVLLEIQKYLLSCHCHGFVYQSSSPPLCNVRKPFSLLP